MFINLFTGKPPLFEIRHMDPEVKPSDNLVPVHDKQPKEESEFVKRTTINTETDTEDEELGVHQYAKRRSMKGSRKSCSQMFVYTYKVRYILKYSKGPFTVLIVGNENDL